MENKTERQSPFSLRGVREGDENRLPTYSYSKLEVFLNCKYRYKLKYLDGNYDKSEAISLLLGSLCHKVMELKAQMIMKETAIDYEFLHDVIQEGIQEEKGNGQTEIIYGIAEIKKKYFEDWGIPDNKSGMSYQEKMLLFEKQALYADLIEKDWTIIGTEIPFAFVYDEHAIIRGFIDRIDVNTAGELRVTDYKTSKASYEQKKLSTPLQMAIYGMACYTLYGTFPIEYNYHFILINKKQSACTKGYLKRAGLKLNKTFESINTCAKMGLYQPSPSPLCYYCPFSEFGQEAALKKICDYHSLWTPTNHIFAVKNRYNALTVERKNRKLIF